MQFKDLATTHSANCFYNSLARDFNLTVDREFLYFEDLKIPIKHYSHVGAHQFDSKDFLKTVSKICGGSVLEKRIHNSIHNMALFLEKSKSKDVHERFNFLNSEQDLIIGHSFHPCPKSRDEFTDRDLIEYAPEMEAKFALKWFLVKKDLLYFEHSKLFEDTNWMNKLFNRPVPEGFVPYPVHPWQFKVLINDEIIKNYIAQKKIMITEGPQELWHATSSMRSLYRADYKYMIKFSMSVKMTNSIRHLQHTEVSRGMKLKDTFDTARLDSFKKDFPHFEIMHEPYFCAIKDENQKILPQSVVLLRENLIDDSDCIMLATLNQSHPYLGESVLSRFIKQSAISAEEWFNELVDKAFLPFFHLQGNYGIYLGAHQQNLIVRYKNYIPTGVYFRDCQGTSQGEIPKDAATHLFTYYFIINSVFNSIASISLTSKIEETVFIRMLKNHLLRTKEHLSDTSVIDHLLGSEVLNQKGNLRCNLLNINENTTINPLTIYNSFLNPLVNI